jgi:hypothetical protein
MSAVIPRDQAIAEAGQLMASAKAEMAERYQQGGARAVAVAAVGEDAPEEVIRAKAAIYETWVQQERARRRRGAA